MTKQHLDYYQRQARQKGYRARSAYKLIAMDDTLRVLRSARLIIELGCAPGGWTQVIRQRAPQARVVACDLNPIHPIKGVHFVQGDFTEPEIQNKMRMLLQDVTADAILSDISPNISGQSLIDQAASFQLAQHTLSFAQEVLNPAGRVLMKFFYGRDTEELMKDARNLFHKLSIIKPPASRKNSKESYLYLDKLKTDSE